MHGTRHLTKCCICLWASLINEHNNGGRPACHAHPIVAFACMRMGVYSVLGRTALQRQGSHGPMSMHFCSLCRKTQHQAIPGSNADLSSKGLARLAGWGTSLLIACLNSNKHGVLNVRWMWAGRTGRIAVMRMDCASASHHAACGRLLA